MNESESSKTVTLPIAALNLLLQVAVAAGGGAAAYTFLPPRVDPPDNHRMDRLESAVVETDRMAHANASDIRVIEGNDARCKERQGELETRVLNLENFLWKRQ